MRIEIHKSCLDDIRNPYRIFIFPQFFKMISVHFFIILIKFGRRNLSSNIFIVLTSNYLLNNIHSFIWINW